MSADRIEHEINIDAPIELVWDVVTTPEHITGWFTDSVELEIRPGGNGRFGWGDKATNRAATVNVQVEAVDAPHFFAFRWDFPNGTTPDETNAPLVEFTLEPNGSSTRLKLVETGLAAIARSAEAKEAYFEEHSKGWREIGERLRIYAAEQEHALAG